MSVQDLFTILNTKAQAAQASTFHIVLPGRTACTPPIDRLVPPDSSAASRNPLLIASETSKVQD